jgi:hypothetical protein
MVPRRKILLPLVFFACCGAAFALPDIAALPTKNLTLLDKPIAFGISYFRGSVTSFKTYAHILGIGISFIAIFWICFKLWFATEDCQKALVTLISKWLLFLGLWTVYPGLVRGVKVLSINMGCNVTGGRKEINAAFLNLYNVSVASIESSKNICKDMLHKYKYTGISEANIKLMANKLGWKEADIKKLCDKEGIAYGDKKWFSSDIKAKGTASVPADRTELYNECLRRAQELIDEDKADFRGVRLNIYNYSDDLMNSSPMFIGYNVKSGQWNDKKTKINRTFYSGNGFEDAEPYFDKAASEFNPQLDANFNSTLSSMRTSDKQAIDRLEAIEALFYPAEAAANDPRISEAQKKELAELNDFNSTATPAQLANLWINIPMTGNEQLLNVSSMLKIGILVCSIMNETAKNAFDYDIQTDDSGNQTMTKKKKSLLEAGWDDLLSFVLSVIIDLGILGSCIFFCIQYAMAIFEYSIITAFGYLLIPCILWDGTSAYAKKLATLFVSFFVKICVLIMCVFFTFTLYLNLASNLMADMSQSIFFSFVDVFLTIILGLICTQNAPQTAQTILSGDPKLSMGEVMHAAATVGGAAMAARKGAGFAAKAGSVAGKAGQGAARGGVNAANTVRGMNAASQAAGGGEKGHNAAMGFLGSTVGGALKSKASELLTGTKGNDGGFSIGGGHQGSKGYDDKVQENRGEGNKRTAADAKNIAQQAGESYGSKFGSKSAGKSGGGAKVSGGADSGAEKKGGKGGGKPKGINKGRH